MLEAIEASLELPTQSLNHEREVLKRYGNMSAPTALFVLERVAGGRIAGKIAAHRARAWLYCLDGNARRARRLKGCVVAMAADWDPFAVAVLAFVTVQRGAELVVARRNTQRLLAQGAFEAAPGHYR